MLPNVPLPFYNDGTCLSVSCVAGKGKAGQRCIVSGCSCTWGDACSTGENESPDDARLVKGEAVALNGVDWSRAHRTLVMVLSTKCLSAEQESSFYRELVERRRESNWRVVAIFPESPAEAREYMRIHGYSVPLLENVNLKSVGVYAIPTLLIVDDQGELIGRWVGKLSLSAEKQVASALGPDDFLTDKNFSVTSLSSEKLMFNQGAR